jgi:hypothetical protein
MTVSTLNGDRKTISRVEPVTAKEWTGDRNWCRDRGPAPVGADDKFISKPAGEVFAVAAADCQVDQAGADGGRRTTSCAPRFRFPVGLVHPTGHQVY